MLKKIEICLFNGYINIESDDKQKVDQIHLGGELKILGDGTHIKTELDPSDKAIHISLLDSSGSILNKGIYFSDTINNDFVKLDNIIDFYSKDSTTLDINLDANNHKFNFENKGYFNVFDGSQNSMNIVSGNSSQENKRFDIVGDGQHIITHADSSNNTLKISLHDSSGSILNKPIKFYGDNSGTPLSIKLGDNIKFIGDTHIKTESNTPDTINISFDASGHSSKYGVGISAANTQTLPHGPLYFYNIRGEPSPFTEDYCIDFIPGNGIDTYIETSTHGCKVEHRLIQPPQPNINRHIIQKTGTIADIYGTVHNFSGNIDTYTDDFGVVGNNTDEIVIYKHNFVESIIEDNTYGDYILNTENIYEDTVIQLQISGIENKIHTIVPDTYSYYNIYIVNEISENIKEYCIYSEIMTPYTGMKYALSTVSFNLKIDVSVLATDLSLSGNINLKHVITTNNPGSSVDLSNYHWYKNFSSKLEICSTLEMFAYIEQVNGTNDVEYTLKSLT